MDKSESVMSDKIDIFLNNKLIICFYVNSSWIRYKQFLFFHFKEIVQGKEPMHERIFVFKRCVCDLEKYHPTKLTSRFLDLGIEVREFSKFIVL